MSKRLHYHAGQQTAAAPTPRGRPSEAGQDSSEGPLQGEDDEIRELRATLSALRLEHLEHTDGTIRPTRGWTEGSRDSQGHGANPGHDLEELPLIPLNSTGDFGLERPLGEGGMGVLDVVEQRSLRRQVVSKRLKTAERSEREVAALLQEARLTGHLEHPNIVPVHALGRDAQGSPVLIMKHIEGSCWRDMLHDPEHPAWSHVSGPRLLWNIEVLMQLCNALHFAHSRGILHRDIKPQNVMIGAFGEVYLLDWGIALHKDRAEGGSFAGTPAYMAPEMLHSPTQLDERADVYLLGATLHEVLTGEPRHVGASLLEVMASVKRSAPFSYDPQVPQELAHICHRATCREPELRYPDVAAFRAALSDFLQHRASRQWSTQADARLQQWKSLCQTQDTERLYRLFHECRFGYRQALEEWPDNAQARAGLAECLLAMFRYEISMEHRASAAALLAEMDAPPPALSEELDALDRHLQQQREHTEQLEEFAHQHDLSISEDTRRALLKLLLSVASLLTALFIVLGFFGIRPINNLNRFAFSCVFLAVMGILIVHQREALFKNHVNRTLSMLFVLGLGLLTINRWLALQWGLPLHVSMAVDLLIFGAFSGVGGLFFHRWALVHFLLVVVMAVAMSLFTTIAPLLFGLTILLSVVFVLLALRAPRARS